MIIKVENNIREILTYLEAKGYIWRGSHEKPTRFIHPSAKCFYVFEGDKTITYGTELSSSKTMKSFEQLKKEIPMKKSDLKPGMVVEYADGNKRLVVTIGSKLCLISDNAFCELDSFNDDLISVISCKLNIVKIYQPKAACCLNKLLLCNNCIWERSKETVISMQEIADKFGIPVEQLKIKK